MINRFTLLGAFILGVIASNVMDTPVPLIPLIATLLFATPALMALHRHHGTQPLLITFAFLAAFALIVEELAVATGIPYSHFVYSDLLGTSVINVPLATPISFFALAIGAYAYAVIAYNTYYNNTKELTTQQRAFIATIGALILVLADLILDPAATTLGLWIWEVPGLYYGVPAINFLGWAATGFVATYALTYLLSKPHPALTRSLQLIVAYWVGVNAGLGLMIPAALGAILSVAAFHAYRKASTPRSRRK